tara:strand:+ start:130 stop:279 length:150 start_codon:yes stop_codon:yes gene_type:complete
MELVVFIKQAAEMGLSPVAIVAVGVLIQQMRTNALVDKRLAIIESKVAN